MEASTCNNCGHEVYEEGECHGCGCLVNCFGQVLQSLDWSEDEEYFSEY